MAYEEKRTFKYEFSPTRLDTQVRMVTDFTIRSSRGKTTMITGRGAINARVYKNGEIVEDTTFVELKCLGNTADRILDLGIGKGSLLKITGSLFPQNYVNKQNNNVQAIRIDIDDFAISDFDKSLSYEPRSEDFDEDRGGRGSRGNRGGRGNGGGSRGRNVEPEDDYDDYEDDDDFEPSAPSRSSRSSGGRKSRSRSRSSRRSVEVEDDVADGYIGNDDELNAI